MINNIGAGNGASKSVGILELADDPGCRRGDTWRASISDDLRALARRAATQVAPYKTASPEYYAASAGHRLIGQDQQLVFHYHAGAIHGRAVNNKPTWAIAENMDTPPADSHPDMAEMTDHIVVDPTVPSRARLALVIPTYRRAAELKQALVAMAPDILACNIPVYVSDDSPDDETAGMISDLVGLIPAIRYRRNSPGLGHDRNIVASLLWPVEEHVWIIGDSGLVRAGGFAHVLALLDEQDFLFVNSHALETADIPSLDGEAARRLIRELLWHQALTGATVYSRRVLNWLRDHALQAEGLVRNFPHLSLLLDYAATHAATIGWAGTHWTSFATKKSYWRRQALRVFVEDWAQVVRRQPEVIPAAQQATVLRSHDLHTRLFSVGLLADLRADGTLSWSYLRRHPDTRHALAKPAWLVAAIAALPPSLVSRGLRFIRRRRVQAHDHRG